MSVTVAQARQLLRSSVMHTGATTFDTDKIDEAIKAPLQRVVGETGVLTVSSDITLDDGESEIDLTVLDDWNEEDFIRASIGPHPVRLTTPQALEREYADHATAPEGRPRLLALLDDGTARVAPQADGEYDLTLTRRGRLIAWTNGTMGAWSATVNYAPGDVVLHSAVYYRCIKAHLNSTPPNATNWQTSGETSTQNPASLVLNSGGIPDEVVRQTVWWGGKAHLLTGASKRPDGDAALAQFERCIERWAKRYGRLTPAEA